MQRLPFLFSCAAIGFLGSVTWAAPITTESLVNEMIDMHHLTRFPSPAYKTVQFSSYDRRSNLPGGPGWFENSDGFGGEPIPNFEGTLKEPAADGVGEYLICDVPGPGAIVRVWTAAMEGTIRLYLDNAEQPVWDGPAQEFLLQPWKRYAERAGVDPKVMDGTFFQKNAAYCPFPFARHCRITWTGNVKKIHFYQIQIRLYEDSAKVVTFRPEDVKDTAAVIQKVARVLADPDGAWSYRSAKPPIGITADVPPGARSHVLAELKGAQAIERLTLKVEAQDLDRALRQTVLRIICDHYPWGQVQSPIGDFFGAAPGINPQNTVPFTVRPDGTMISRYVMPFAESCRIVVDNWGQQPVKISGSVLPVDAEWDKDRSMHFRARWRVDHDLIGAGGDGVQDMPYLVAGGKGVYVGSAVMLLNPNNVPSPNGNWWGEGDEKIFVDEDVQPSTFGTGSEDYFNYSWSLPDIFVFPYFGQPRNDGPANRGFVTNNRWHILDPLPFQHRLAFYMELYPHEETPGMSYARIGYHYARPGLMDDHVLITPADLRHLELPEEWQPAARRGSANSVFFQAEDLLDAGKPETVSLEAGRMWAGKQLMVWRPQRKGDELTLAVPIDKAGKYTIHITAALRGSSGPISVQVNGQPAGFGGKTGIIDLKVPHRVLSRDFHSADREFEAGKQKLTLRYEGTETPADIGIDFVWPQKR